MSFKYEVLGNVRYGYELEDILTLQGIKDIKRFINPTVSDTESELLYENIRTAQWFFDAHIKKNDVISLLCDCDADGVTSAALIYQYIHDINPDIKINYYVHKGKEHGLTDKDVFNQIIWDESKLVIIPDAGSDDIEQIEKLIEVGKDVIILDHHEVKRNDGSCGILVNNQFSEKVTDKALTGVGVVYKFCKLLDKFYHVQYADNYLDLVAVGCIGDRASMLDLECRYLVLQGLEQIKKGTSKNKLIKTLVEAQSYSMNNKVTINNVGFYICPLINSMIRLGEYEDKVYMFEAMCNSDKKLMRKVRGKGEIEMSIQEYVLKACESTLRKQRKITEESANALTEQIENYNLNKLPILVVNAGQDVDENSTGLIANRLAGQYSKPCLLLRNFGDVCSGSGRGSDKSPIVNLNEWCEKTGLFTKVAGHPNAFGVEIPTANTNKLFETLSKMDASEEVVYHVYNVYTNENIHSEIIRNVAKYDNIWGNDVEEPIFLIKGVVCNKLNINLLGQKQNRIQFDFHNIKFNKFSKGGNLLDEYKNIVTLGDNIEFDIIGRFMTEGKSKTATVIIDDWEYKKSDRVGGFGL